MLSLKSLKKWAENIDAEMEKKRTNIRWIPSREEEAVEFRKPKHPLQRGHDIMDNLRKNCDSLDTPQRFRSPNQVLIQNRLSGAIARLVYGTDLLRYEKEIIKYNNFSTIRQEVATTMPRRSGKSQSVAEWIACAMLSVPGFDAACFSNSARAAGKEKGMLGIVKSTLMTRFGYTENQFSIKNDECIQIIINGDKRTLHSYPGACHTLRGVGGNVIIVEEASYVSPEAFRELIIPLMALSTVCFCALSTLGAKSATWFNKLIDSGLVDAFTVEYVCPACFQKGERKPCIHRIDGLPHWGAEDRVALMNKMYGEENKEVYLREVMGIIEDMSEGRVFSQRKVREALTCPFVEINRTVHRIFISIDPCAGTDIPENNASDWAAIAFCEPGFTILGQLKLNIVDSIGYRDDLYTFLSEIRKDEYLTDATFIVAAESGTGFSAPDVYSFIRSKFYNVETLNTAEHRLEGVRTTEKAKMNMVELMNNIFNNNQVRFWKKYVTTAPNPAKLREEWADQFCEFKRVFVKGTTVRSRNSFVLTGKESGKKDDMVMSTMIGARVRYLYDFDPEFRNRSAR